MTKIDIFSGFLGAGKTTLIKKCLKEAFQNEQIVLIENEFGEIGIDGGFLEEAGIQIREMNSGCICCSLVGDFSLALSKVVEDYHPDRILIEPSGVGKLSDIIGAVEKVKSDIDIQMNSFVCVVDAKKVKMYSKNFGEFYNNQIESANVIVLSRSQNLSEEKLKDVLHILKEHNDHAAIITTPWDQIDGKEILDVMESRESLEQLMLEEQKVLHEHDHDEECECGHHHHHHDEECECGHHHHHDEECECGHHHHHDEECECGHHHHHDEECECGHHHHHDADEVFTSWGSETIHVYSKEELDVILESLNTNQYGTILRAKGMVASNENDWFYFDMVPGEVEIRLGKPQYTGRVCVIGSDLKEDALASLFEI
ncbi:GTP-binding protein [Floccifex sp.]|uniref:GTP-binding protein n=1 Tax=Floccifex sp. TaxID=2815810 RepID=UPI003F0029EF